MASPTSCPHRPTSIAASGRARIQAVVRLPAARDPPALVLPHLEIKKGRTSYDLKPSSAPSRQSHGLAAFPLTSPRHFTATPAGLPASSAALHSQIYIWIICHTNKSGAIFLNFTGIIKYHPKLFSRYAMLYIGQRTHGQGMIRSSCTSVGGNVYICTARAGRLKTWRITRRVSA